MSKRLVWWWPAAVVGVLIAYGLANFVWGIDREWNLFISGVIPTLFIFAILAIGLDVIAGDLGLLHLGAAGTVAIGSYAFSILTTASLPFQFGFWPALVMATVVAALAGVAMAVPVLGLRGDYLAIVTMGFGEIVQIAIRNLSEITRGSQGVNPVAKPSVFGYAFSLRDVRGLTLGWILLAAGMLALVVALTVVVRFSRIGRAWRAIRDDQLAANAMGLKPIRLKLAGFALGSAWLGLGGALYASNLGTSGEPGTYSLSVSVIVLCMVVLGGMGKVWGALVGALLLQSLDLILLPKVAEVLRRSTEGSIPFLLDPTNYRLMIFGVALILVTRWLPGGLAPEDRR